MCKHSTAAVSLFLCTLSIASLQAATVTWKSSTDGAFWADKPAITTTAWDNDNSNYISVDEKQTDQEIDDWSGCVNERPWDGIMKLSQANRDSVVKALFDTVEGILTNARCPLGMNDMSMGKYTDDDFSGDYTMAKFNINQDKKYLIPHLKAAMALNPHLKVWCSPWSPPPWMKTDNDYYGGRLKTDAQTRNAFALYLEKWCQAYKAEGINIYQIYHQNEPEHENDSWLVTHYEPADYLDFLKNYLYPKFRQDDLPVESGVGTCVQDDSPPTLIPTVLNDTVGNSYVTTIAIQYSTKNAQYCHQTWPLKRLMMSETPAGGGEATWSYGEENWGNMRDYLQYGVNSYAQWDIADVKGGTSNEGKPFSAPIVVDTVKKTYTLTPMYWQVKHITYFVKPGALRIKATGNFANNNYLAFVNRNGQNAVIVANTGGSSATVAININGQKIKPTLPAHSFNSFSTAGTPLPDSSPYNQMQAVKYWGQSGTYNKPCSEGGTCLSYIHNNEWAYYNHLDFSKGASAAGAFQARVAGTVGGSIEIRVDSLTGTALGTCTVDPTGGATTWKTVSCNLTTAISGKHILYLKFKGTGTANLFDLNWWKFIPGTSVITTVAEAKEAGITRINVAAGAGKAKTLLVEFSKGFAKGSVTVNLFDLTGRLIANLYNGQVASSELTLPLNRVAMGQGAYIVKVLLDEKVALTKTATF